MPLIVSLDFTDCFCIYWSLYSVQKSFEKKPLDTAIESRETPIRNGDTEQWKNLTKDEKITELYSSVIDILAQCEHQAGTSCRPQHIHSNEQESQHNTRPQEGGHVSGTDQGCCNGICCHTILSMLRSASSQSNSAPTSALAVNENTPLNVSTHARKNQEVNSDWWKEWLHNVLLLGITYMYLLWSLLIAWMHTRLFFFSRDRHTKQEKKIVQKVHHSPVSLCGSYSQLCSVAHWKACFSVCSTAKLGIMPEDKAAV